MTDTPKSILIVGAAKSGTTALFYAVRKGLSKRIGAPVYGLFEPKKLAEIAAYLESGSDVVPLAKALLGPLLRRRGDIGARFDRRILIFRDPRDNVVSRIAYMLGRYADPDDPERTEALLDVFRRKEQAPGSLSVLAMFEDIQAIVGQTGMAQAVRDNAVLPADTLRTNAGFYFPMPYDDMVEGRLTALSDYLGFGVPAGVEVGRRHAHVVRTRTSGAWRDWFLNEDVDFFAHEVAEDLRLLGFEPDDRPHIQRLIAPQHCSEFVQAQFDRARARLDSQTQATPTTGSRTD